ncbi:MAG: hypothetical protein KC550_06190 [Nanoarchaeota archaeon]|nr:hypothetical protein [Nanoarchaeota archaeon]
MSEETSSTPTTTSNGVAVSSPSVKVEATGVTNPKVSPNGNFSADTADKITITQNKK